MANRVYGSSKLRQSAERRARCGGGYGGGEGVGCIFFLVLIIVALGFLIDCCSASCEEQYADDYRRYEVSTVSVSWTKGKEGAYYHKNWTISYVVENEDGDIEKFYTYKRTSMKVEEITTHHEGDVVYLPFHEDGTRDHKFPRYWFINPLWKGKTGLGSALERPLSYLA